ncbi:hypothetical protein [Alkalicoccobacillus gibsonii]|uniref:hypothetical protein n=1 Tax=Alkalicoccobacillus gibsonii TaxID=79881 RepID=UPI0019329422|nr:hypothetical protein [Alkalicoccobacillus gibsonii]MBM0065917.1 hypothetical protein [Alkalicoccobacillus gibsonii]
MASFKQRAHHSRYMSILTSIMVMPIIAILAFLDVIPVSTTVAWFALVAFFVSLIIFFVIFKGRHQVK